MIPVPRHPTRWIVLAVAMACGVAAIAVNDQDATRKSVAPTTTKVAKTTPRAATAPVTESEIETVIRMLDPALRDPNHPEAVRDIAKKYLSTAKNRKEIRGLIATGPKKPKPPVLGKVPNVSCPVVRDNQERRPVDDYNRYVCVASVPSSTRPPLGFVNPTSGSAGYVGFPANRADRFNVIGIGTDVGGSTNATRGNEISLRFRADHTGPISQITTYYIDRGYTGPNATCARYWVDSTGYSNYACGTGGIVDVSIQADDGSANHFPSGTALATTVMTNPLTNGCATPGPYIGTTCTPDGTAHTIGERQATVYKTLTFGSPYTVTAGNLYHIVWKNTHSDKENNFWSFDWLGFRNKGGPKTAQYIDALPRSDWAVGVRTGNDPDPLKCWDGADATPAAYGWDFSESSFWPAPPEAGGSCAASSHFETYSPPVGITWADGWTQGSSYYETAGYYVAWYLCGGDPSACYANTATLQFNTTQVIRQVFNWPRTTTNTTLEGFLNMGQPVSGIVEMTIRNTSTNAVLAQCTAAVSNYGQNPKTPNTGYGVNPNFPSCTLGAPVTITSGTPVAFEYRMSSLSGATAGGGVYSSSAEGVEAPVQVDGVDELFWTGANIHDTGHAEWCPNGPLSTCSSIGAGKRDISYMVLTTETSGATTTTTSVTTTTAAPSVPAVNPQTLCSPGRRFQAETDWTGVSSPGTTGSGFVTQTNPGSGYRIYITPNTTGAISVRFRVHNNDVNPGTRTLYYAPYPSYTPLLTTTISVPTNASWQDDDLISLGTLTGGQVYEISPSWDTGNTGRLSFDYMDVCGDVTAPTTTTTAPGATTTTTTIPSGACITGARFPVAAITGSGNVSALTDLNESSIWTGGNAPTSFRIDLGPTPRTVKRVTFRFVNGKAPSNWSVDMQNPAGAYISGSRRTRTNFRSDNTNKCFSLYPIGYANVRYVQVTLQTMEPKANGAAPQIYEVAVQ